MSALGWRVVSSLVGLPLLVGTVLWGEIPFVVLTIVLAALARREMVVAYTKVGIHPSTPITVLGSLAPASVLILRSPLGETMPAAPVPLVFLLASVLVVASLWETGVSSHERELHTGRAMAYGMLVGGYVSLFGGVALLRTLSWSSVSPWSETLPGGAALVLTTVSCTIASDTGAFFAGRSFGRHKLAEGLSPKKTIEGWVGGTLASVVLGVLVGYGLLGSVRFGMVIGLAAGLLGPLGDLFKSALKREIGIKDFGSIIPGHGGVVDRFDSLLFTAPVVGWLAVWLGK